MTARDNALIVIPGFRPELVARCVSGKALAAGSERHRRLEPNGTYFVAARREPSGITIGKPGGLRRSANRKRPQWSQSKRHWASALPLTITRFVSRSDYESQDDRAAPLLVIHRFSPQRGSHKSAQGRAERRSRVAPPWVRSEWSTPALKGRNKPWPQRTNDACGMNRFVSPLQGYRAETNPYPGRRSAAVACLPTGRPRRSAAGLICFAPLGRKSSGSRRPPPGSLPQSQTRNRNGIKSIGLDRHKLNTPGRESFSADDFTNGKRVGRNRFPTHFAYSDGRGSREEERRIDRDHQDLRSDRVGRRNTRPASCRPLKSERGWSVGWATRVLGRCKVGTELGFGGGENEQEVFRCRGGFLDRGALSQHSAIRTPPRLQHFRKQNPQQT